MILLLPLLAAACASGDTTPTLQPPPGYAYLTPLRLNVLDIEVVEPGPGPAFRTDPPAPLSPSALAAQMGRDRLVAVGTTGRARFLIDSATLIREVASAGGIFAQQTERLTCVIRVRVEILGGDGRRVGFTEAEVRRSATVIDEGPASRARAADQIVRQAMDDLNVEFEFQLRRNLRDWLMNGDPGVLPPAGIQQESLDGGAPAAPAPAVPASVADPAPSLPPPTPRFAPNLTPNLAPPRP
ncbi:hypothetical protein [Roseomonas marmotae]|uniref:Lipoprotein n=1 Tax=Roseomonas marmotae TaxID=2768161 RepID=A0ABS3KC07_9PROT|nr:hypothetical protein [Roseomonas marmotae]MBO1074178.1 hypothetical protein [Roseomonas marmotae]QTI78952.1 hypothetical protein IAI58_15095 [Roseomonas marmotae]